MYTKEVFQRVKEELERRRTAAEASAAEREKEVHDRSPQTAAIDAELSKTGFLIFKAATTGSDIKPIRERNRELNKKRVALITDLGLPENYTDTHYTCSLCSDTGYKPDGFMCSCMRELIRLEGIKESGMGKLIEKQSFETFDLSWYKENSDTYSRMTNNVKELKRFADNFTDSLSETYLFIGKTGTGKTHLSSAVAKRVIEKGFSVLYDSVQNIISDFETDKFKNAYGFHELKAEKYLTTDLLIVDDLGTEFTSQFTLSVLYNLINTRQNKGLSTIISTNLTPEELSAKYEDRIFSRLIGSGSTILVFSGRDHRVG